VNSGQLAVNSEEGDVFRIEWFVLRVRSVARKTQR
jgi:hypothetical protein